MERGLRCCQGGDKVVLFLGEHFLQTGEATSRGILELPQIQQKLLREITAVNPNTAVVLFTGRRWIFVW